MRLGVFGGFEGLLVLGKFHNVVHRLAVRADPPSASAG